MNKNRLLNAAIIIVIMLGLFAHHPFSAQAASAQAGGTISRELPLPAGSFQSQDEGTDVITFTQLLQDNVTLTGPYDSYSFSFDLPYEWVITQKAKLNLLLVVSGGVIIPGGQTSVTSTSIGGTITVSFNDKVLDTFPIDAAGNISREIEVPVEAFQSVRDDGRMQLNIFLESAQACTLGQNVSLIVLPVSSFTITHTTVVPDLDLTLFPRPIYEKSLFQRSVVVVVPDAPTATELQSAMAVVAGLGNLSSNTLKFSLVPVKQLTPELQQENLIFVGRPAAFPGLVAAVTLPLLSPTGAFDIAPDDGLVEMVNSPWSKFRVVLLATGNTDAGTLKAAQAISSGFLMPGKDKNVSVIKTVNESASVVSIPVDQTLAGLGYTRERLTGIGVSDSTYLFYVPPGQSVTSDAYFNLLFGHSALIDFDRSGIVISVNGQPIGSVRMSAETAVNSTNSVKFTIPPSILLPGINRINIAATMQPLSSCNPPDFSSLWVNIWPESALHLPLTNSIVNFLAALDLSRYPAPFVFTPDLANTAFVLPKDRPEAWNEAAQIAAYLGDRSGGSIALLKLFFDGEIPEQARALNHFIVIGRPAELDTVKQLNSFLPVPFQENSSDIVDPNLQVVFRVPPDTSVGYVELLQSPWSSDHIMLFALGNSVEGLTWAAASLTDTLLGSRIAGNFSMINEGGKVATTDTRTASFVAEAVGTVVPDLNSTPGVVDIIPQPAPVQPVAPTIERPAWILTALGISVFAALVIAFIAIFNNRRQDRQGRASEKVDSKPVDSQGEDRSA